MTHSGDNFCPHCRSGDLGEDMICRNGVMIDIDEWSEGWSRSASYPYAPCHPKFGEPDCDIDNDSQERLGEALRSSVSQDREFRRDQIVKMREAGETFSAIAAQFGISRQRAHQIYNGR